MQQFDFANLSARLLATAQGLNFECDPDGTIQCVLIGDLYYETVPSTSCASIDKARSSEFVVMPFDLNFQTTIFV